MVEFGENMQRIIYLKYCSLHDMSETRVGQGKLAADVPHTIRTVVANRLGYLVLKLGNETIDLRFSLKLRALLHQRNLPLGRNSETSSLSGAQPLKRRESPRSLRACRPQTARSVSLY